jgi:RimJ/RimL family protein N-acetyltransferase
MARTQGAAYEFIVLHEATEQLLGVMGLHRVDWSRRSAGLGYWIRQTAWGQGFAPEAAASVIEHGFRSLGLNRIEAHVALENKKSQRVVEKLGFQREGIARELEIIGGRPLDHYQYGLLQSEVVASEDLP